MFDMAILLRALELDLLYKLFSCKNKFCYFTVTDIIYNFRMARIHRVHHDRVARRDCARELEHHFDCGALGNHAETQSMLGGVADGLRMRAVMAD